MRRDKSGFVIALLAIFVIGVFAVMAANASAAESRLIGDTSVDPGNFLWSGTTPKAPWADLDSDTFGDVPVDDSTINTADDWMKNGNWGLDVTGADVDLPGASFNGGYGGRNISIYDSATLTPNSNPLANPTDFNLGGYASLEAAAAASTQTLKFDAGTWSKQGKPWLFIPVEFNTLNNNGSTWQFYGPVKVNTALNLNGRDDTDDKVYTRSGLDASTASVRIGNDSELHAYGPTNINSLTLDHAQAEFHAYSVPTIGTFTWNAGTYSVNADGAFPGVDPLVVPASSTLNIGAAQSLINIPKITVPGFSLFAGNMTNMVYDSTHANYNCELQPNAIFNPRAGETNLPTLAELGGSATLYTAVSTSNDDVWVGDDGTSIYKGAANGAWYGSYRANNTRIHANPGSGDLQVVYFGAGCPQVGSNVRWYGDGTSTTADVSVINGARLDMQYTINQDDDYGADPTLIRTLNITGETGQETRNILYFRENHIHIRAEQIYNVSKGSITGTTNLTGQMPGTLNITDGPIEAPSDDFAPTDGNLGFGGRTELRLPMAARDGTADPGVNYTMFENLGARFTYSGLPVVTFTDDNNPLRNYKFDLSPGGTTTPVLAQFLANADYGSNHYHDVDIAGDGLVIGDGKFLSNAGSTNATGNYVGHQNADLSWPVILPGQSGAITMGFAALGKNLGIDLEVVAPEATLQLGTTDPDRLVSSAGFVTGGGVPEGRVTFKKTVTAKGVKVESGTAQFNQDLDIDTLSIRSGATFTMASGKTATVNELLTGGGTFGGGNGVVVATGATLAPGDSPGTLTGQSALIMQGGTTYQWELADPIPGPGLGWDLLQSDSLIAFQGDLTFLLADAGLTGDVNQDFLVATTTDVLSLDPSRVTIDPGTTGWNVLAAELLPQQNDLFLRLHATIGQQPPPDIIPEPGTMAMLALAAVGLGGYLRKRRGGTLVRRATMRAAKTLAGLLAVGLFLGLTGAASAATLTAYYNFEGNYNDFPGAGVNADDLTTQRPGASLVVDAPANALGSTMSYAFDQTVQDSRVWTAAWSPDITSTDQYTIMFWLKADDDLQQMNNTRLASVKYDLNNAATTPDIGWQIEGFGQSGSGNGPDLRIQSNPSPPGTGNFFAKPANGALGNDGDPNNDVWHHIAFVISNTGSTANNRAYMETYLDGASLGQNEGNVFTTGSTLLRNLNGRLILGGHNQASRSATGRMDDFALLDGVVSGTDIAAIAAGQLSPADFLPQDGDDIPEPGTMALSGLMLAGLGGYVRRRRGHA